MVQKHHHYYFIPPRLPSRLLLVLFIPHVFFTYCLPPACIFFSLFSLFFNKKKIQANTHLTWFIENYPSSAHQTRDNQENSEFWNQFK